MDPVQLQAWIALINAGFVLGKEVYRGVVDLAGEQLSTTELVELHNAWHNNVVRSAENAGIPAVPETPLS